MKTYLERTLHAGKDLSFAIPHAVSLGVSMLEQATQPDSSQVMAIAATLQPSSIVTELASTQIPGMDILSTCADAASALDAAASLLVA